MKRIFVLCLVLALGLSFAASAKRVAVILDVGGEGDQSFNDMAFAGAKQAAAEFGWEVVTLASTSESDYLPNVRNAARDGTYDLIVATGFLLTGALNEVAPAFPDQPFAIVDVAAGPPPWNTQGPNIMNLVFNENEMSALVGALGAMTAAYYGYSHLGAVLGVPGSVLYHFEAGLRYGIAWANAKWEEIYGTNPGIQFLYNYIYSFDDEELGESTTTAQLAAGAVGVYNVAGPVGFGDHRAVVNAHTQAGTMSGPPYYFGVDANQDYFSHTLASGMKRVDVAVYEAIKAVEMGTFFDQVATNAAAGLAGGYVGTLANSGVKLSKAVDLLEFIDFGIAAGAEIDFYETIAAWAGERAALPNEIWDAITEMEEGILDGSIQVITANTDDEMNAIRSSAEYELGSP
ncbi:BMP family ABC transporter substrate-binding protein [Candidatus Bipolaricaulota bacterium]|nr:BMP family ABC transporter substrate-binding protein [Candidatus Bipolaricaulota bacterium]